MNAGEAGGPYIDGTASRAVIFGKTRRAHLDREEDVDAGHVEQLVRLLESDVLGLPPGNVATLLNVHGWAVHLALDAAAREAADLLLVAYVGDVLLARGASMFPQSGTSEGFGDSAEPRLALTVGGEPPVALDAVTAALWNARARRVVLVMDVGPDDAVSDLLWKTLTLGGSGRRLDFLIRRDEPSASMDPGSLLGTVAGVLERGFPGRFATAGLTWEDVCREVEFTRGYYSRRKGRLSSQGVTSAPPQMMFWTPGDRPLFRNRAWRPAPEMAKAATPVHSPPPEPRYLPPLVFARADLVLDVVVGFLLLAPLAVGVYALLERSAVAPAVAS